MSETHPSPRSAALSRRRFLKTGAAATTLALPGCENVGPAGDPERPALARPTGTDDNAWAQVRAQFILEPGTAYLNNASLGMPPAVVADAVGAGYRRLSQEPLHGKHELADVIADSVLPGLATFVGANPDELSLTRNASEALHFSAIGFDLQPGDEVLTTTQEHPGGRRPWEFRAARDGLRINEVFIPSPFESEDQVVELFEKAITPRTRAMAFCHVTRGGHLYPVKKLAALARSRGLLCQVDGAQAFGMFPIDVHDLGCDTYSVSLHKWFLGPSGTGFLYVREGARDRILSAFAADATVDAPSYGSPGTADLPVKAGLLPALEFAQTLGTENVGARTRYLSDYLKGRLSEMSDVRILSGTTPETSCPGSTIFEMDGVDAVAAVTLMEERIKTHIDEHQRDGHDAIRISTHVYNTQTEIDRLIQGLETLRA